MDISFWKNLSSDIEIKYTTKKFFNQYLYKLDIDAPGCKSVRSSDIRTDIEHRRQWARTYSYGGSWVDRNLREQLEKADVGLLYAIQDIINEYPEVKIRIEEPKISFYADSHTMIESLARAVSPDLRHHISSITVPENNTAASLLTGNIVLVKKKPKYKYRVWFREKQFSALTRQQVYNYLTNLGDLVKISETTKNHLTKSGDWIWGSYFYTDDLGIVELVRIINPEIIREVSELVCM